MSRVLIPILLGLGVVAYMIWRQLDMDSLRTIPWTYSTIYWLVFAILAYVIRHLLYAWRLRIMTDNLFSWSKSIELIFIWEFSSAVSPSSIGGAAVALFFLAQEKISAAKTVTVVIYSMLLDTLFFLVTIVLLVVTLGPIGVRPDLTSFSFNGYMYSLLLVWIFMFGYGILFFYGMFISPDKIRGFLFWLSKFKLLKRFQKSLLQIGQDMLATSKELKTKPLSFHLNAILSTAGAWIFRFLAINFIILALVPNVSTDLYTQYLLYSRGEIMHSLAQFSPTPGGAGMVEYIFGGFYSDFIPKGITFIVALVWRIITYYPYLIIGAIIIPNWVRKIVNRKRLEKAAS